MVNPFATDMPADAERWARQLWQGWADLMRGAAASPSFPGWPPPVTLWPSAPAFAAGAPSMPNWQHLIEGWMQQLQGTRGGMNDLADQFNTQARHWFAQMQQLAAQFGQAPVDAGQITQAWRRAVGATGQNPFPELFRSLRGPALQGMEQWVQGAQPMLDAWRSEAHAWLSLPTFGLAREHQERWQQLLKAQLDYQRHVGSFNALMAKAGEEAFALFEQKLIAHEEPGQQLTSARALFDLWIDACEEAYARVALSPEFRSVYAQVVDAQMALRLAVQGQVEQVCEMAGLPTRSEVDAAHRKVAQLERQVRRLQQAMASVTVTARPQPARSASSSATQAAPGAAETASPARAPSTRSGKKVARTPAAKPRATAKAKPKTAGRPAGARTPAPVAPRARAAAAKSPARAAIPANAMPMAPQPLTRGGKNRKR